MSVLQFVVFGVLQCPPISHHKTLILTTFINRFGHLMSILLIIQNVITSMLNIADKMIMIYEITHSVAFRIFSTLIPLCLQLQWAVYRKHSCLNLYFYECNGLEWHKWKSERECNMYNVTSFNPNWERVALIIWPAVRPVGSRLPLFLPQLASPN